MKRQLSDALILDFAYKYVTNENARQAALSVGYPEKSATRMGYYLSHKPEVVEKINKIRADLFAQAGATPKKRAFVLAARAVTDIRGVASWKGNALKVKDSADLSDAEAAAIKEVKMDRSTTTKGKGKDKTVTVYETISLKMYDGIAAEDLITRKLGEIPKEPQQPINIPILVIHSKAENYHGA